MLVFLIVCDKKDCLWFFRCDVVVGEVIYDMKLVFILFSSVIYLVINIINKFVGVYM